MNLTQLRDFVRDLTGVYETTLVSDTSVNLLINNAYFELARLEKWSWLPVAALTDLDSPAFSEEFHTILSLRAASQVLYSQADDTPRGEYYMKEYSIMLEAMRLVYFPKLAAGLVDTRADMRQHVRDISGVQSDILSDALINQWLQESYQAVARQRSWDWLEDTATFSDITTVGPHALGVSYPRVLSVQLVDQRGTVEEAFERPSVLNVASNRRVVYYDVDDVTGEITLAPEERFDSGEPYDLVVRYSEQSVSLVSDIASPLFDVQFNPMLCYYTAARALRFVGREDDSRTKEFVESANAMFSDMVSFYELSHDDTAFQMGIEGRELQQYPYWFRRI